MKRIVCYGAILLLAVFGGGILLAQDLGPELVQSIEIGDLGQMKRLLKEGADPNQMVKSSGVNYRFFLSRDLYLQGVAAPALQEGLELTPLMVAAFKKDKKAVKILLKEKANKDAADSQGKTPIMYALWQPGGEKMGMFLLKQGANYMLSDEGGNTALHYAAFGGSTEGVHMTVGGGLNINLKNNEGITPFLAAAVRAPIQTLAQLEELGADLQATDQNGMTALHYAARYGSPEKLGWLLGNSIPVDAVTEDGLTALDIARMAGNTRAAEFLQGQGGTHFSYRIEELIQAVNDRNIVATHELLMDGANPNAGKRITPLHIAVRKGLFGITELLLRYNADPNIYADSTASTPLEEAIRAGNSDLVGVLADALSQQYGNMGSNPLCLLLATHLEGPDKSRWMPRLFQLLPLVSDLDAPGGPDSIPALHYAARQGNTPFLSALLEKGADANAPGPKGLKALHWAALGAHFGVAEDVAGVIATTLLEKGAEVNPVLAEPVQIPEGVQAPALLLPAQATPFDVLKYVPGNHPFIGQALSGAGGKSELSPATHFEFAQFALKAESFALALQEFEIAAQGNYPGANLARGECLYSLGRHYEALQEFKTAERLDPGSIEALIAQGKTYYKTSQFQMALETFDQVLKKDPQNAEAIFRKAYVYIQRGQKDEACILLKKSLELGLTRAAQSIGIHCK